MSVLGHMEKMEGYQAFRAGTTIIKKGERGDVMYIVKEGTVEVRNGRLILDTVGPGGVVGEVALIDSGERTASVVAKTDCRLLPINEEQFVLLVERMPYFALQVMKVLADRLRRMTAESRPTPKRQTTTARKNVRGKLGKGPKGK